MNKPLVIYHKDCADGLAAAWCFWKEFGDSFEYVPGVYGAAPPDVFNRDVYLVDFSYKHDVVEVMCRYANKVVVLDHHKSALEDLWDLTALPNFDMDHSTLQKSGAMISWEYVKKMTGHKRKLPQVLSHIQDRDLWQWKLPHTREIMTAIFSYEKTFENYDKFMRLSQKGLRDLIAEGVTLERKYQIDLKNNIEQCVRIMCIGDYKVPVANMNGMYASDAGAIMSENQPFAATYYDTEKHRVFSLCSREDGVDVSEIAKKFNGGGHRNAAGFKVDRDHPLAKI